MDVPHAKSGEVIDLRFLDRDALPEARDALAINGGGRVPVVLFLSEDGFEVSVLTTTGSANEVALATALQDMWGALNVRLTVEQLEAATETERYRNADFDMRVAGWTNDINDPSQITSYFAIFDNIESLYTGFQDDEIDTLFAQSQEELDTDARAELYRQIQTIYMDAAPIVFLYENPFPVALQASVKGFVQIPLGNNIFKGAYLEP